MGDLLSVTVMPGREALLAQIATAWRFPPGIWDFRKPVVSIPVFTRQAEITHMKDATGENPEQLN